MRHSVLLLLGLAFASSALAARNCSLDQLAVQVARYRNLKDDVAAQRVSELELTERPSASDLEKLRSELPGEKSRLALNLLADQAVFLDPPASEIPALQPPNAARQREILELASAYVARSIPLLPNLLAIRETSRFEDRPLMQNASGTTAYEPLHLTGTGSEEVTYRAGREEVRGGDAGRMVRGTVGLTPWGVFGPILGVVLGDAARGTLVWSHWEQGRANLEAVFRYSVPKAASHYAVDYCCVARQDFSEPSTFRKITGYHGAIALDPTNGTVLRMTVQADLRDSDPITRADVSVEYGPVEMGGKVYICPIRSIAISSAEETQFGYTGPLSARGSILLVPHPHQLRLSEARFAHYQVFRADVRMLVPGDGGLTEERTAAPPATAGVGEPGAAGSSLSTEAQRETGASSAPAAAPAPKNPAPVAAPPAMAGTMQAPSPPDTVDRATPTLSTTAREVLVDVVVTDRHGHPITGLAREDFEVDEGHRRQTVDFFEESTGAASSGAPAGPGASASAPPSPAAVTVLLLDTLNTEQQDQVYVHQQMDEFLRSMPAGTQMAIVVLGSELRFIEGITADASALRAGLNDRRQGMGSERQSGNPSRGDLDDEAADVAALKEMSQMSGSSAGSEMAVEAYRDALANMHAVDRDRRAAMTFAALDALARILAPVRGRKNLIWFASSFPVVLFPSAEDERHRAQTSAEYQDHLERTTDLLTSARVAIYPVNAQGVMSEHFGEADSARSGGSVQVGREGAQESLPEYNRGAAERANTMSAMEAIAESTGGRAFFNTNDFSKVVRLAIQDGGSYYTIGYSPSNRNMDGSYRQLEVRLKRHGLRLAYRRGYYATGASF